MPIPLVRQFLQLESASSILLLTMTICAVVLANSPLVSFYHQMTDSIFFIVNEGLMTFFFLLVGLELKREFYEGELSSRSQAFLPGVAALGGMAIPAFIYVVINYHEPQLLKGWAIPVATDIAFALGVLTFFGKRIPIGLKVFLMALAIFDDLGAIIIIAIFYTDGLSFFYLFCSAFLILVALIVKRKNINSITIYLLIGFLLWMTLFRAGIHPTISGVITALMIPLASDASSSRFHQLENKLHNWVAYLIVPLFALVNAGFTWQESAFDLFSSTLVMGVILGLFLGKQIGVFLFSWLLIKLRLAKLPSGVSWQALYGVALLCGIGFTMSLFIGMLSFKFTSPETLNEVRFAVMLGSLCSGLAGALVLQRALR